MRHIKDDNRDIQRVLLSQQNIGLTGVPNARELGGYESTDGRRIKRGRLIRSGHLCSATAEDNRILGEKLRTGLVVDLRSPAETAEMPETIAFGAQYVHLPVLDDIGGDKPDAGNVIGGETELYSRILFGAAARAAYKQFFKLLLESDGKQAILFHSVCGKDRTGVAAALLMSLLDIPETTVIDDYMLSNKMNIHALRAGSEQSDLSSLAGELGLTDNVYAHSIRYVFSVTGVEYGSVAGYVRDICGLSENDIYRIKNNYLE